ncbi:MAG: glycosyltransferase, partial [Nitrososphaera sp.]
MAREDLTKPNKLILSVIIPTYNESQNISGMLDSVSRSLPIGLKAEIIVVDDSSPDGTGDIASEYAKSVRSSMMYVSVIRRPSKMGLSSAILEGVRAASGEMVLVMDSDFSHPPQTVPRMIRELQNAKCDIVIASRYVSGGSISGWTIKRKLMSKGATKIAQYGLGVEVKDPMSGFFAFKRHIINDVNFDAIGYKMLLEILVKTKGVRVKEIPYTFTNRRAGSSKVDSSVVYDYLRAVYKLYRFGASSTAGERRTSVRFFSKAGRFYTVGATGLLVNYAISALIGILLPSLWYLYGTVVGIAFSITSNFFLNKIWTFEDRDFTRRKTALQFGMFAGFSSVGALLQLFIVYALI